jgi:chemotaxis protein methyltransferase CheR
VSSAPAREHGSGERSLRALSAVAGLDLAAYRTDHVVERVGRALAAEQVGDEEALIATLATDPAARGRFRRSIAVSVSGLFRDPEQFEQLERELLPGLLKNTRRMSVWSAGCADGTELHSAAILLDHAGALERSFLLGSDVLDENIATARRNVGNDGPVARRLRERMRWERRDIVSEGAPRGKWRLVLCRNVTIYLASHAKAAVHRTLAGCLAMDGILVLGRSERLSDARSLGLEPAGPHAYRRLT